MKTKIKIITLLSVLTLALFVASPANKVSASTCEFEKTVFYSGYYFDFHKCPGQTVLDVLGEYSFVEHNNEMYNATIALSGTAGKAYSVTRTVTLSSEGSLGPAKIEAGIGGGISSGHSTETTVQIQYSFDDEDSGLWAIQKYVVAQRYLVVQRNYDYTWADADYGYFYTDHSSFRKYFKGTVTEVGEEEEDPGTGYC